MKVSTTLVVAALVALSTSANTMTDSTSGLESDPDHDIEQLLSTTSSSSPTTEQAEGDSLTSPYGLTSNTIDQISDTSAETTSTEPSLTEPSEETTLTEPSEETTLTEPSEGSSTTESSEETTVTEPSGGSSTTETSEETTVTEPSEGSSTTESSAETSATESTTEQTTSDGNFTDEQKSIWIERFNFFRVAALPWAAGNMMRMGWNDDLAKDAAQAAASCSASTTIGLNVFESTSTDPSIVVEEAINNWVIEPSLSNIGSVVPPAAEGDAVGAGLYNSYTQVIWASTTNVGCAMASCSGGSMVVCNFSPAGNDGTSAWYVHSAQAKQCPTGTTAVSGLCVVEGDPANDLIAPIPEGKSSLQVYPTFIADIMAAILKAAQARDAPGADLTPVTSPDGSASDLSPEQTNLPEPDTSGTMAASSAETGMSSLDDPTSTEDTVPDSLMSESSGELSHDTSYEPTSVTEPTSASNEDYAGTDSLLSGSLSSDLPKDFSMLSTTDSLQEPESSLQSTSSDEDFPGKVKSDSAKESYSDNQEASPSLESVMDNLGSVPSADSTIEANSPKQDSTDPTSLAESADPTSLTEATDPTSLAESTDPTSLTESSGTGVKAVVLNNESSFVPGSGTGVSAVGIAGMIVMGVVAVAAVAVIVSYRKNQKRQHDIMDDGGIEIIEVI